MRQVVANVPEYSPTKDCCGNRPIPEENEMCELPERSRKSEKKGWWHNQSQLVHW